MSTIEEQITPLQAVIKALPGEHLRDRLFALRAALRQLSTAGQD